MKISCTALFLLFTLVSLAEAQRGGGRRGGRGRPRMSVEEATAAILDPNGENKDAAFLAIVTVTTREPSNRGLPSFFEDPEALYLPGYVEMRREYYGPLRADPVGLEYLQSRARDGGDDSSFVAASACTYLADEATPEDLRAMAEGFRELSATHSQRASRARNLGRAVAAVQARGDAAGASLCDEVIAELMQDLEADEPTVVVAALEGLNRCGGAELVHEVLTELTSGQRTERARKIVQSSTRLLQALDPDDPARTLALEWVREGLDAAPSRRRSILGASDPEAVRFRESLLFLAGVDPASSLDLLLDSYRDLERAQRLGIDGLQSLRNSLQRFRRNAEEDDAARMDEFFWGILADTAQRLFDLDEEPMTPAEQARFFAYRDVRYNAASYFQSLWTSAPGVRACFEDDPDAVHLLELLMACDHDEVAGEGADRLYSSVKDKEENRVLCASLLALCDRDLGLEPESDLTQVFLDILAEQVVSEAPTYDEMRPGLEEYGDLGAWAAIDVVRSPADGWVRDRAIAGLRDLGLEVRSDRDRILVRPTR